LVTGMTDPNVASWFEVGLAFYAENTYYSEEAQGMTTDGTFWYMISNGAKVLRIINNQNQLMGQLHAPSSWSHIGAAGYYDGWVYVPVESPFGVWKVKADLTENNFIPGPMGSFPWAAVNPQNGRMYTCDFGPNPPILTAYDRNTLVRKPEDDILLKYPINNVQGGVFTPRGRIILVTSDPNGLFVYSAKTGYCFGAKSLGNYGSTGSEVEAVAVRAWNLENTLTTVHVLELDNDWANPDDMYLHSYWIPQPQLL
jgi:hypothetical protein